MSERDDTNDLNGHARRLALVSALADGELRGEEFVQAAEAAVEDPQARAAWHAYHVIGDVLRSGEAGACGADTGFTARFAERLAREASIARPAVAAPAVVASAAAARADGRLDAGSTQSVSSRLSQREAAANSPVFRWKMAAGLAMGVAIGAVGWNVIDTGSPPGGSTSQLASLRRLPAQPQANDRAGAAVLVRSTAPQMIRDPRLDELLAAHEQSGGVSALQMPAGFLRSATFEDRGR